MLEERMGIATSAQHQLSTKIVSSLIVIVSYSQKNITNFVKKNIPVGKSVQILLAGIL